MNATSADERGDEQVLAAYPGAITIANLLRTLGWLAISVWAVFGVVGGGELGYQTGWVGTLVGALIGGVVGIMLGAVSAATTFAIAYILLLLTQIEANTRISAVEG